MRAHQTKILDAARQRASDNKLRTILGHRNHHWNPQPKKKKKIETHEAKFEREEIDLF